MSRGKRRLRLCAHRGGAGSAPENTLAACRLALELGAEWVEVDVRYTADRVPVLLHDDTVDRTTDGRGPVRQMPFARLRELDAGGWFAPRYRGERIPSLEELLALLAEHPTAGAYVEVKEEGEEGKQLAEDVLELVDRWHLANRMRLASFSAEPLQRARQLRPQTVLVALQHPLDPAEPVPFALERGAQVWGPYYGAVTEKRLQEAHRSGVAVYAWTVNDPREGRRLWRGGLGQHPEDALATDFPDRLLAALEDQG